MKTTIVTCYFQLRQSKQNHHQYQTWMENMLKIRNEMIIFCDHLSQSLIKEYRTKFGLMDKTHIIPIDFFEFYTYKYYTVFHKHQELDHELHIGHNPLLYMIWNEKSNFLLQASKLNPFQSNYFLWVDIGCFRNPSHTYTIWPNSAKVTELESDKILLLQVQDFTKEEWAVTKEDDLPSFQFLNRIGGTIFGGNETAIRLWHEKYSTC